MESQFIQVREEFKGLNQIMVETFVMLPKVLKIKWCNSSLPDKKYFLNCSRKAAYYGN